jgi:3-oxoadipate enol-lactonase
MTGFASIVCRVILFGCLCGNCSAWPQTMQASGPGSFLSIDGSKVYFEECGTSPQTVVLLHDGVLHSAVWDEVWPEFCQHFHTIRYDRRGYGRSSAATSWYLETDDLAALLRHLKVNRAAIVGSSHGGEISINFTLDHQLVLVGAVVGGMPYSQHFLDRGNVLGKPLEKGDVQGAISEASKDKYLFAPGSDAAKKRMAELLSANSQDMTHAEFELRPKPALPRLHEIRIPTLCSSATPISRTFMRMQARSKLEYPGRAASYSRTSGTLCTSKSLRSSVGW